ncbi:MAG: hypothetical protein WCC04_03665 [Terriglobales bacterium]
MWQQYNREELYQKVWEKPLLRVAEQYGVSSVALGKVCRKLSIPVPGRGHWAKLAHGQPGATKPELPKLDKVPIIYRSERAQLKQTAHDQNNPDLVAVDQLLSSGALNTSLEHNTKPNVLIRQTASLLRSRSRKDEHGILLPREPGGLNVRVTEGTLDRALQIMSQVLCVLEKQNLSVDISEQGNITALIQGQRISFGIEEPIRKVVTQKPRVPNPTDRWDYDEVVTFEPSGMLALIIHSDNWDSRALRKRWSDAKIQRIEILIPDFVAGLMRVAVILRQKEEERKRHELEEQKRTQELARLRKEIEEEEKKLEQFKNWVENWERAEQMRRFIAAYAEKSQSWAAEKQPKHRQWVEWATRQADRLDPFVQERPASVLDRKHELGRY